MRGWYDTCLIFPKCRICICTDQHGALLPRGAMSQVRMQQLLAQAAPARPLTDIPPFSTCLPPETTHVWYFLSVGYVSVPIGTVHCCPRGAMSQVRMQQLPTQAAPARLLTDIPPFPPAFPPRNDTCLVFPKCRICICTDRHGALLPQRSYEPSANAATPGSGCPCSTSH